jgi:hypothetical protein
MNFIKANLKYVIPIVLIIVGVILFSIRERVIVRQAEKIASLEMANFGLNLDRQTLEILLEKLRIDYSKIENTNDSLKGVLLKYQLDLINLKKQHEAEIKELTNIPPDSIFKHLTAIYPNYDGTDTRFPFSSSQIKPIYSTFISYGMIQQEYSLQTKSLNTCFDLNKGYEVGINNLTLQIGNLKDNITKANLQIGNYTKEVKILNKKIANKGFWNKSLMIAGGIAVAIAIIK